MSATFHGRDIMAPAAAHLANGVPLSALGPPLKHLVGERFPEPVPQGHDLVGEVVYVDQYGNCVTNLPPNPGTLVVRDRPLPRRPVYGAGPPDEAMALAGSAGFLEIAVRGGSAAERLGIAAGAMVILRR
jgi:S-adenosylmethionine hydrolase